MGFYEDDRIRSKNRLSNAAYAEFSAMRRMGFTDEDIVKACHLYLNTNKDFTRNEIYLTVLKIVGRSREEGTDK